VVIQIITQCQYNEHTTPIFQTLGILPYEKIIEQAKLTFMHSIEYKYSPKSFANVWQKNSERNTVHELRNDNDYCSGPCEAGIAMSS
jgi:hypothetical protein